MKAFKVVVVVIAKTEERAKELMVDCLRDGLMHNQIDIGEDAQVEDVEYLYEDGAALT